MGTDSGTVGDGKSQRMMLECNLASPRRKRMARRTEWPSPAALPVNAEWMAQDMYPLEGFGEANQMPFSLGPTHVPLFLRRTQPGREQRWAWSRQFE